MQQRGLLSLIRDGEVANSNIPYMLYGWKFIDYNGLFPFKVQRKKQETKLLSLNKERLHL